MHQPSPHWKSQITHLDKHHLVFGINFQIHFVSLVSPVSIYILIHLSTHPSHHSHSQHPSLLHSFTPGSNLPLQQILPTLTLILYSLDCLRHKRTGPDLSRSSESDMWPTELCYPNDLNQSSTLFQIFLFENKCSLFFWSLTESPGDLAQDNIADDLDWPLKVISLLQTVSLSVSQ